MVPRRHSVIYGLFLAVAGVLALLEPSVTHSAPAAHDDAIPAEAMDALREGRYLRASLVLRDYLATRTDTAEAAIILAARAEAGWGDWERVRSLLEGRSWLDRVAAGYGWQLLGMSQLKLGDWRQSSISLGHYLDMPESEAGREQALSLIRRGRALAEQRDYDGALTAYDLGAELLPLVGDWIEVFAAVAAAGAGDTAEVRLRLGRVDVSLASEWAWRTEPRARRSAGDLAGALVSAERAAERLVSPVRQAAAWTYIGQLRAERRDLRGARAAYVRAMESAAGSAAAVEAARALSSFETLTPDEQLLIGRVYLRHNNAARGVPALRVYLASGRGTPEERERLLHDIANAYFRAGDYREAERALLNAAALSSDRSVAADAAYTAARAQYRDGRGDLARETLRRVMAQYDGYPAAARAAYLTADLHHDDGELVGATEYYRRAIRIAPTSTEATMARMRIAGIAWSRGNYDAALAEFEALRALHVAGPPYQQATFWAAMALERTGRSEQARQHFAVVRAADPFSYYGGLAAERLGEDIWQRRLEPSPEASPRWEAQVQRALARVDLLREIGWDDAANFEMERAREHFSRFDGALYSLAEELNARGFTSAGIALGREIHRREGAWNLRLLRIVYPFPYRNIIMAEARERSVDPFLVAALIRQESMFNERARSPVGAVGLMQVMPQTGASLARRLNIPRYRTEMLAQPELNVAFGVTYLADQLKAYGDRLDAVLAAYNAGPGRVARWQRFPEWRDGLLFAERIPFDETRDYVRIVQNNRRIYAAIYGDAAGD
jgi:soluble lytic murein transglycosylase